MRKKTDWMDGIDHWGLGLERFALVTTKPVDLDNLGRIPGIKVTKGEQGTCKYDVPGDDQIPECPYGTTLLVTTASYGKTQSTVRTEIDITPASFNYKDDLVKFLRRILKVKPESFSIRAIHLCAGGYFGTLKSPTLESLFVSPQGFLLEKSK